MKKIKSAVQIAILALVPVILVQSALYASEPMQEKKKILYYRNPMGTGAKSPVPIKDEMGMDYIPVYQGEESGATAVPGHAMVAMKPEKQELLGIRTVLVEKKPLTKVIRALGMVGHEEMLYDAQLEYIKALRDSPNAVREKYLGVYQKQFVPTAVEGAKLKLMQLGIDEQSIAEMDKNSYPDKALLHLAGHEMDWVSFNLYEYEAAYVKRGDAVEVEIPSMPGVKLKGEVKMVSPFVDEAGRTIKGRALVQDANHDLKPEMSITVVINADRGMALAVPLDAVLLTGARSLVYVEGKNGAFEPREVVVGAQAGEFYEIKQGLMEGEKVAVNGNFLIDSESRLNSGASAS